jgi:hypothetical protein
MIPIEDARLDAAVFVAAALPSVLPAVRPVPPPDVRPTVPLPAVSPTPDVEPPSVMPVSTAAGAVTAGVAAAPAELNPPVAKPIKLLATMPAPAAEPTFAMFPMSLSKKLLLDPVFGSCHIFESGFQIQSG